MFLRLIILISVPPLLLAYEIENGKDFEAAHYSAGGEQAEKNYVGHHQSAQGAKGRHDKENHRKQYAENGGRRSEIDRKDGYYANQHQGYKGGKGYHFEDEGRYAKGHSTKGHHNVHKLNEYKKNTDFFDEDDDEDFEEKHGGYEISKTVASGGHRKAGRQEKAFDEGRYGKLGFNENGVHYFDDKRYKKAEGQDAYYGNGGDFVESSGEDRFKKFGYIITHK